MMWWLFLPGMVQESEIGGRVYDAMVRWHGTGYTSPVGGVRRKVFRYSKKEGDTMVPGNYVVCSEGNCAEIEVNKVFMYGMAVYDDGTFPELATTSFFRWLIFKPKPTADRAEISISRFSSFHTIR